MFRIRWAVAPLLFIAAAVPAQYTVNPAVNPFAPIAGLPGAVQLATVSGCDDCVETVNLSFPFAFMGQAPMTSVNVSSNGAVIFDGQTASLCCSPWALDEGTAGGAPVYFTPVARASIIQEDLDPAGATGGDIWALDTGVSMIISFENVSWYPGPPAGGAPNGAANGQIELFINGDIEIRLGTINNLTNDFACGLSDGTGNWISPMPVIPQFNQYGQTTGAVAPQNTGCYFTPAGAQYQINQTGSSLDVNGVQGGSFNPAVSTACVGGSINLNSSGTGNYEIGIALTAAVGGGVFTTAGGQVVNLDLTHPSLFYLNGGAVMSTIPHPGSFTLPIVIPTTLTGSGQQLCTDPGHPDGFQLSQCPTVNATAAGSAQALTLGDDNFVQVFLQGQPTCANAVSFYGTTYTDFFVESNGGLRFVSGSGDFTATSGEWQTQDPRIGIQSDFEPNQYGTCTVTNNGPGAGGDWMTIAFTNFTEWGTTGMGVTSFNVELHGPNGHEIGGFTTDGTWGTTPCVGGITNGSLGTHPALVSFDALFGLGLQANANPTDSVIDENTGGMLVNTTGWTSIQFPFADGSAYAVN